VGTFTKEEALNLYRSRNFSGLYSDAYNGTQEWLRASRSTNRYSTLADFVLHTAQPRTALDVGCGKGDLVNELRKRGIKAWGIDASQYIFNEGFASEYLFIFDILSDPWFFGEKVFDVVCVFEVLEHFLEEDIENVVSKICFSAKNYIVGSISDDPNPPEHFTIKNRSWWDNMFTKKGFEPLKIQSELASLQMYGYRRKKFSILS